MQTSFSRYDKLNEALNAAKPLASDVEAMELLKCIRGDTVWSVVYDLRGRNSLLAVHENYGTLYHFGCPQAEP